MNDYENEGPGLQPIGSLLPPISSSPSSTECTTDKSPKPPTSSAITGSRQLANTRSNLTGRQRGETASELLRSADSNRTSIDPEELDRALDRSLPQCVTSCLKNRSSYVSDPVYGFSHSVAAYDVIADISREHERELRGAIALLENANQPSPPEHIVFELGRLRVQTKAKAEDSDNIEFILRVYAEDMRAYPADVVREACRKWARNEKFFPAWCELKTELDRMANKRMRLLAALRKIRVR